MGNGFTASGTQTGALSGAAGGVLSDSIRSIIKITSVLLGVNCIVPSIISDAVAGAPYEEEIERLEVLYKNGSSISVICNEGNCGLQVKVDGTIYKFSREEMSGIPAYPSNFRPVLFLINNESGRFSFEVQLECQSRGFPKKIDWPCFGNYLVSNGKVEKIHKYILKNGVVTPMSRF
jgi:hypothetical protein